MPFFHVQEEDSPTLEVGSEGVVERGEAKARALRNMRDYSDRITALIMSDSTQSRSSRKKTPEQLERARVIRRFRILSLLDQAACDIVDAAEDDPRGEIYDAVQSAGRFGSGAWRGGFTSAFRASLMQIFGTEIGFSILNRSESLAFCNESIARAAKHRQERWDREHEGWSVAIARLQNIIDASPHKALLIEDLKNIDPEIALALSSRHDSLLALAEDLQSAQDADGEKRRLVVVDDVDAFIVQPQIKKNEDAWKRDFSSEAARKIFWIHKPPEYWQNNTKAWRERFSDEWWKKRRSVAFDAE